MEPFFFGTTNIGAILITSCRRLTGNTICCFRVLVNCVCGFEGLCAESVQVVWTDEGMVENVFGCRDVLFGLGVTMIP